MTRIFLTIAFAAAVAMGCDSTDTGGAGGAGSIGPLNWVASDMVVVGDTCGEFFKPEDALEFDMNIDGSNLTMMLSGSTLTLSTDDYMETDDVVTVSDSRQNSEFDPCVVQLDSVLELDLDDPDVSIDLNGTLSATWSHSQAEVSTDQCEGEWGFNLPCEAQMTMTLTQSPAPE